MSSHDHHHGHHHGHHGHHHDERPADFDWEAMANTLELDGEMLLPVVHDIVRDLADATDWGTLQHVIDVGCGPGVIAHALAAHAPHATVTALDSSMPLLARVQARAAAHTWAHRLATVEADLDHPLPALPAADVIWASMVLHHVADPAATLAALHEQLRPGGTLVVVEFAGPAAVLPADDPLVTSGAWARLQALTAEVIRERLGNDPLQMDWPQWLAAAGFEGVTDRTLVAHHRAPLSTDARRWVAQHVNRGLRMAAERVAPGDVTALQDLADDTQRRDDLYVRLERRVFTARRA